MLVVLVIMGLLASVAMLSMPGDADRLRGEGERLAARATAARDEAITAAAPVALLVGDTGYAFERRLDGAWAPLPGRGFGRTEWASGTHAATPAGRIRVVFDSLGLASSDAQVRLTRGAAHMTLHIARNGGVRLDAM